VRLLDEQRVEFQIVRDQHSRVAGDAEKNIPHQPIVRSGASDSPWFWLAHTASRRDCPRLTRFKALCKPIVVAQAAGRN